MEIVRSNFLQSIPIISEAIEGASFLAMDGEFSGLNTQWKLENSIDTPQERYAKVRSGCKDFILIQFGLCAFSWDNEAKQYIAKPFNFYIFPRVCNRQCPDVRFLCQSSSIEFLVEHSFDFNKLFREGISYLRPYDEQKLRDYFETRSNHEGSFTSAFTSPETAGSASSSSASSGKTPVVVPPEHKEFVEGACNKIEEMLADPEGLSTSLPPCNGYLRKLIYQSAKQRFKSGIHMESMTNEAKQRVIMVTKVDNDKKKTLEEEKQAKEMEVFENAVGFSKVVKLISQSGKILVGHNSLLDLMHTLDQFVSPLPDELDDFKATVRAVFPRIVDTKVMGNTQPFKDHLPSTTLGDMVKHLTVPPFKKANVRFHTAFSEYENNQEKAHEAAYDAYMTGTAFISMINYLGSFQDPPKNFIPPESSLITPFLNKIFVMRMEDIPYLNLSGADLNPSRKHVFHLSFPSEWKYGDILNLFNSFGFVYVAWINQTSAFVSLAKRDGANKVMECLDNEEECYRITTYAEYRRQVYGEEMYETPKRAMKRRKQDCTYREPNHKTSSPKAGNKEEDISNVSEELEEGEIEDSSPEPARKRLKSTEKAFDESQQW